MLIEYIMKAHLAHNILKEVTYKLKFIADNLEEYAEAYERLNTD